MKSNSPKKSPPQPKIQGKLVVEFESRSDPDEVLNDVDWALRRALKKLESEDESYEAETPEQILSWLRENIEVVNDG